jgi:predicted enzyme related to lactoylglutathione lyase
VDAAVERLVAEGASAVGPVARRDEYWVVLADPEGNEFCVQ